MNNPYKYNAMMKDGKSQTTPGVCVGNYNNEGCEVIGQNCDDELQCNKPGWKCFQGTSEQEATDKCEAGSYIPVDPSKKKPSKGKVVPIGGKDKPLSGPKPGPTPGPGNKNFWNSTSGIITIIAICLGIALLLVGITYAVTKRKTVKK